MIISFFLFYSSFSSVLTESDNIHKICVSGIDDQENCLSLSPLSNFVKKDNLTGYLIELQKQQIKNIEISVIGSPFSCSEKIELDLSNDKLDFISYLKIRNGEASDENHQYIKLKQLISKIPFKTLFLDGVNVLYDKNSKQKNVVEFKSLILIQSSILTFSQSIFDKSEIQKDYLLITSTDLYTDSYSLSKSGNTIKTITVSNRYTKFLGFPKYQSDDNEINSKLPKFIKNQKSFNNKIEVNTKDMTKKSVIPKKDVALYLNDYLFPQSSSVNQQIKSNNKKSTKASYQYYVRSEGICTSETDNTTCEINRTADAMNNEINIKWVGESSYIDPNLTLVIEGNQTTYITFSNFSMFYTNFLPNITLFKIQHYSCSIVLNSDNPDEPVPFVTVIPTSGTQYRPKRPRQLKYCVCLQSRFQRCKQSLECSDDGVDPENYVTGKEDSFLDAISDYRTASQVRLIITHTGTEVMNIDFKTFYVTKEITFISASSDITTQICLREDKFGEETKYFSARFHRITRVNLDEVFKFINLLILQNADLNMNKECEISNIFTDAYSIQDIQYKLTVSSMIAINSTSPLQLPPNKIVLSSKCLLYMPSISGFPHIVISGTTDQTGGGDTPGNTGRSTDSSGAEAARILKDGDTSSEGSTEKPADNTESLGKYIRFSDEDDIYSMTFMLEGTNQSIYASKTAESNVNITIDTTEDITPPSENLNEDDFSYFFFDVAPYGMQVQFLRSIPTWMKFVFVPPNSDLSSSESDSTGPGTSLNLTIEKPEALINFADISGNFDLILMSESTLRHFVTYGIHKDETPSPTNLYYNVSDLRTLTIDFQSSLSNIVFADQSINYGESLSLPKDVAQSFRVTTVSSDISFNVDDNAKVDELELYLLNRSTRLTFQSKFSSLLTNYDEMQKLNFIHFDNDVTLIADGIPYVPFVNLTENVTGVLFEDKTGQQSVTINSIERAYGMNSTRKGPTIEVTVESDPGYVLQEAVLARSVTFIDNPFKFAISAPSRASYVFKTNVTFVPRSRYPNFTIANQSSNPVESSYLLADQTKQNEGDITFQADSVTFGADGAVNQTESDGTKNKISINANSISADKISSIDSNNFNSNGISVSNTASLLDPTSNEITLGGNKVAAKSSDGSTTPTIQGANDNTNFQIDSNEKEVTIKCDDKTVPNNVKISTGSNTEKVVFDKSWNGVTNPEGVTVNLANSNTELNTEMLTLPNVTFTVNGSPRDKGELNVVENKASLTGELGFFIFLGIFAFVLVLALGFAIIGCCSLDKQQQKKKDVEDEGSDDEDDEKAAKKKEKAAKKEEEEKAKGEKKKAADEAKQQKAAEKAAKKGEKDAEKAAKKGEKEAEKAAKKGEKEAKKAEKADKKAEKADKKGKGKGKKEE